MRLKRILLLILLSIPVMGARTSVPPSCLVLFEDVSRVASGNIEKDLERGKDIFAAAIPRELMKTLITEFQKDEDAAKDSERAGKAVAPIPIAGGNIGHMSDHLAFYEKYKDDFQKHLGVDPLSLKLAIVAHDIGKGFLDELMNAYVAQKTSNDPTTQFVNQYVLAHEFHTIARMS